MTVTTTVREPVLPAQRAGQSERRAPRPPSGPRPRGLPRRRLTRDRLEPWRDWAVLAAYTHAVLLTVALWRPAWGWLLVAAVPLSLGLATGTLTVLHDAGHRQFGRQAWPNVLAVQSAVPAGLWAAHWTLKHRVHHRLSQVYPVDEATRSSSLVRMHPDAPWRPVHRYQHLYTWFLYGLAWMGELRSQLRFVRTGVVTGAEPTPAATRITSFAVEKALWLLVLTPYAWLLGVPRLAVLLVVAMTLTSVIAAVVLAVGHINVGLAPTAVAPSGREWAAHLVRTTASFGTDSVLLRWLTGGLTHHLAHHLRPTVVRSALPALHLTTVRDVAAAAGAPVVDYPGLSAAIAGHYRRLRELGRG